MYNVLPTGCGAGALILTAFASFSDAQPSGSNRGHYVAYQQEDTDSNVEPDSDAGGDYDVFYDGLASQGRWFNDDDYGYVWQPNVAESGGNWRPYSDGHWVWTDQGWFWQSNEEFGWATYHYGRWIMVAGTGWVWVPGDQWAPAWVSWRRTEDDDYVGWAPLPPEASFSVNVGFQPWSDSYYDIGPASFAFIRVGDFCRPSYRQYFAPPQQILALINRTRNVTNITYNNNAIFNNGPQYQRVSQLVEQRAGQRVPNYRINYAAQKHPNSAFKTSIQGNQLNVFAPPQKLKPIFAGQPQGVKQLGKRQVERGWQNVPQEQTQQLRQQFAQQAPVPQTLPPKPALPGKPQIQTVTKTEAQPPGGPVKGQQGPDNKLQPFVEKPGSNGTAGQQKLQQQKLEAENAQKNKGQIEKVQPENLNSGQPPRKPAVVKEQGNATTEKPNGQQLEKSRLEQNQRLTNAQRSGPKATQEESLKAKKAEPKKEPPSPPQTQASRHSPVAAVHPPPHRTERVQNNQVQQQAVHPHRPAPAHVAQATHPQQTQHVVQQPHPQAVHPQQPHRTASNNNQKKKGDHKE